MNSEKPPADKDKAPSFVSTRNVCKLCAPLGASLAFCGIEDCVPLIHGPQRCAAYIRRYVISHFKKPMDIASSDLSETAVFGGAEKLKTALNKITSEYRPQAIGIASTCLTKTSGDDVASCLNQYIEEMKGKEIPIMIHALTPNCRGTYMEGFHEAVRATVTALACGGAKNSRLNIIPGFLSTADLRYLKEIMDGSNLSYTMLPDYAETLDGESWAAYKKLSPGGTPVSSIRSMGQSVATIQLGASLAGLDTAASYLASAFDVRSITLGIPVGIMETDRFFNTLARIAGVPMPWKFKKERERLLDAYIDGQKHISGKRAVIYGEADFVASLASFLDETGIVPVLFAIGTKTNQFRKTVQAKISRRHQNIIIREDADFDGILEICRDTGVDIVIGNSKGYYLAHDLGIPLVRAGFPIYDHIGGQRILHIGYAGTQQLFDRIVKALIGLK